MHSIECKGLTKQFGKTLALDHLDLKIEENSIFGFLGPNGAGKTTTIKLMCGLLKPTDGSVTIRGKNVLRGDARKIVGYLPEEPAFYGWMDGREFLDYIGKLFKISAQNRKERIKELSELMQMEDALTKKVSKYSKGMKQRLGIIAALINDPSILILDEPCADLDPLGRMRILESISQFERTVFFSSHILSDIERVSAEVGIIHKGRLLIQSELSTLKKMFIKPVIEVTVEEGLSVLEKKILQCSWVENIQKEGDSLRILSKDIEESKKEIPRLIYESKALVTKYEVLSPELEDIFKQIVEGKND
ncbi:MAG: ABC transporter ATP-binding protein [Theionarchaea archaeon]|nr:ABC transporter ATP-binding protein [Theionarchaea archaeon]